MHHQAQVLSEEVTQFLDGLNHPLRKEIEKLRQTIASADLPLRENVKWNGPNYTSNGDDRITMKIQPPKVIQIIFHRGAKVKEQPAGKLISDESGMLSWRENDRAIATFRTIQDITDRKNDLVNAVRNWISATEE
jgi:hypothetical protein